MISIYLENKLLIYYMFIGVDFCLLFVYKMYELYNYGFYKVCLYFDVVYDLKYFYVFVIELEVYCFRKLKRKFILEKFIF